MPGAAIETLLILQDRDKRRVELEAQLKAIPASQFVAVDESCLMVKANSGLALQPGSAAFAQKCPPTS